MPAFKGSSQLGSKTLRPGQQPSARQRLGLTMLLSNEALSEASICAGMSKLGSEPSSILLPALLLLT